MAKVIFYVCLLLSSMTIQTSQAKLIWHWEDDFSPEEKGKLTQWITQVYEQTTDLVAPFPFDLNIHLHNSPQANEPVPWAGTSKGWQQRIHFHVNPKFKLKAFLADWTAPHEFAHMYHPYLGRTHSWFSEGFASYMQYIIMEHMGVIDRRSRLALWKSHLARAEKGFRYKNQSLLQAMDKLKATKQYPILYWGGATYFMQVDQALRKNDLNLIKVWKYYVTCCRLKNESFEPLIARLDSISNSTTFSEKLKQLETQKGFPVLNFK